MDKLSVIREAHRLGGPERSSRMNHVAVFARQNQCAIKSTSGRGGTLQIRYGSLNFPVLDMTVEGQVTIYVRPTKNEDVRADLTKTLATTAQELDGLNIEIDESRASGKLGDTIEEIPEGTLTEWVSRSVAAIREHIYDNPEV